MLLLALLVFLSSVTLFNVGGTVPTTGTGDVLQAPARNTARLTIKPMSPATIVAGTGFKSDEVVRLTGIPVRQVRASARGTFTIRLRSVDPCNGLSVTAVGSKGSRASVNYSQLYCAVP
jgi:hypothetical protein